MNDETRTSSDDIILEGTDLRKTYRLGRVDVPVLHGASISIKKGEWVAVLGASGSGKSTLLHLLGGLDRPDPDGGHIYFQGERVGLNKGSSTNRYRNSSIGFVFQFYHLLPELDVLENAVLARLVPRNVRNVIVLFLLAIAGTIAGGVLGGLSASTWGLLPVEERSSLRITVLAVAGAILGCACMIALLQLFQVFVIRARTRSEKVAAHARQTIGEFRIDHRVHHRPRELSGGERQRVAIARALGNDPMVLLADEPTGNLDASTGREILDLLKARHEEGLTIVMVTHDPTVAHYADRIVQLEDGRIVKEDTNPSGQPNTEREPLAH